MDVVMVAILKSEQRACVCVCVTLGIYVGVAIENFIHVAAENAEKITQKG